MCAIHQYAIQEDYNDFHEGDNDEEIEMESPPAVVAPALQSSSLCHVRKRKKT
jgi:hypothetical protein